MAFFSSSVASWIALDFLSGGFSALANTASPLGCFFGLGIAASSFLKSSEKRNPVECCDAVNPNGPFSGAVGSSEIPLDLSAGFFFSSSVSVRTSRVTLSPNGFAARRVRA